MAADDGAGVGHSDGNYSVAPVERKVHFPHQSVGLDWLRRSYEAQNPGHIMAWAMRAGKSRTSVEFIAGLPSGQKSVIVAPAQVRKNWAREFRKWADIDATIVSPGKKVDLSGPGVFIVSYELAKRFYGNPIDILVLDEMHYLASTKSNRSRHIRDIVTTDTFVVGLSGTPIPNTVRDLWNQVDTVWPGSLGSCGGFIVRYSNKVPNEWSPSGHIYTGLNPARASELQRLLAPFWHRVVKQDFAHLLPKFDVVPRYVTPKRKKFDWDDETVFEELLAANSPQKLDTMMEVLDEAIEGGQTKFCVAAWLHQTVDQIAGLCAARGWEVFAVDGRVAPDKRLETIDAWGRSKSVSVLVAGIGAVGIGLSLSAAETSVMVEIPFRPSDMDQFINRFNDAEHDHAGLLVPIVVENSREEKAIHRYITKKNDIDAIVAPSSVESLAKERFEMVGKKTDESILDELAGSF
jgi:SNF2 family DNA or RNA helicase